MIRSSILKKVFATAILIGAIGTGVSAYADTPWQADHPRREEVNSRLENQYDRIRAGSRDDQLTRGQARYLHAEDRNIRGQERLYARFHGGHISRAEQRVLNREENRVSRQIYRDRHDYR